MKNQRRLFRAFYEPREQIYLALIFLVCWTALMGACSVFYLQSTRSAIVSIVSDARVAEDTQMMIDGALSTSVWVMVASLVFLALMLSVTLIALSTRVFGPSVQFKRLIRALRSGDYSYRGQLRRGDAFQDLMDEMNALAGGLETRAKG